MKKNDVRLKIPSFFRCEKFTLFKKGIFNRSNINVYINTKKDFSFLYPLTNCDYTAYVPRVNKLKLMRYKKSNKVFEKRFAKIRHLLKSAKSSIVEIGAHDGAFLRIVKKAFPLMQLYAVEPDTTTLHLRRRIRGLKNYSSLEVLSKEQRTFDVICLFHIFEHLLNPEEFLLQLKLLMHRHTILIIEVPSLYDPLLSLYQSNAYADFYFQEQHPFVYSASSLDRLLCSQGFKSIEIIPYQRYGLENHLNWLIHGRPGGNEFFRKIFTSCQAGYLADIERSGKTDTFIWVGRKD